MEANFKKYSAIRDSVEAYGAVCAEGAFDWAREFTLPRMDVDLPRIQKRGKIAVVMEKRNPIFIMLSDGTQLFFTYDEFKRIKGKPEVGKTMSISMLRLPHDSSGVPSKIDSCEVI